MREHFLLDPDLIFLNHGSFGACPRVVIEAQHRIQLEMERNPVEFFGRRSGSELLLAREAVAQFVGTRAADLVFVENATVGVNILAHSIALKPGDEILASDHEYGACQAAWQQRCRQSGALFRTVEVPLPLDAEQMVAAFRCAITPHTRVLFVSHITSPTALVFPIEQLIALAHQHGIMVVIDGAHGPGFLDLDLDALKVDFYTGNCHKWMCAPKGAGFVYARPDRQCLIQSPIISWGQVEADDTTRAALDAFTGRSAIERQLQWLGTRDLSAALSVPFALQFFAANDWWQKRAECRLLAQQLKSDMEQRLGATPIAAPRFDAQMVCHRTTRVQWRSAAPAAVRPSCHRDASDTPRWPPVRTRVGPGLQHQGRTGAAAAGVARAAAATGSCLTGGRHGLLIALLRGAVLTSRISAHDNAPIFATLAPWRNCVVANRTSKDSMEKKAPALIAVRNSEIHGRGVYAVRKIKEGQRVIEYRGERIGWPEALRRHPHDPEQPNHTFYFTVDDKTVIDGNARGNDARWINHGCAPNCEAELITERGEPRVFIQAMRDISAGEETDLRLRSRDRRALHPKIEEGIRVPLRQPELPPGPCWRQSRAHASAAKGRSSLSRIATRQLGVESGEEFVGHLLGGHIDQTRADLGDLAADLRLRRVVQHGFMGAHWREGDRGRALAMTGDTALAFKLDLVGVGRLDVGQPHLALELGLDRTDRGGERHLVFIFRRSA